MLGAVVAATQAANVNVHVTVTKQAQAVWSVKVLSLLAESTFTRQARRAHKCPHGGTFMGLSAGKRRVYLLSRGGPLWPPRESRRAVKRKEQPNMNARLLDRARKYIRAESRELAPDKHWLGIAPSYLCAALHIGADKACALLLALEAEGFIYDNGNGGVLQRADGHIGTNRFFMRGGS